MNFPFWQLEGEGWNGPAGGRGLDSPHHYNTFLAPPLALYPQADVLHPFHNSTLSGLN